MQSHSNQQRGCKTSSTSPQPGQSEPFKSLRLKLRSVWFSIGSFHLWLGLSTRFFEAPGPPSGSEAVPVFKVLRELPEDYAAPEQPIRPGEALREEVSGVY